MMLLNSMLRNHEDFILLFVCFTLFCIKFFMAHFDVISCTDIKYFQWCSRYDEVKVHSFWFSTICFKIFIMCKAQSTVLYSKPNNWFQRFSAFCNLELNNLLENKSCTEYGARNSLFSGILVPQVLIRQPMLLPAVQPLHIVPRREKCTGSKIEGADASHLSVLPVTGASHHILAIWVFSVTLKQLCSLCHLDRQRWSALSWSETIYQ